MKVGSVGWLIALSLLLALFLVACREPPPPPAVGEAAVLLCNETCAARGQCGTLQSSARVVLANQGGPAVTLHDTFFPHETTVDVAELSERQVLPARNNSPLPDAEAFNHTFYRVRDAGGQTAWVSGWCVVRP